MIFLSFVLITGLFLVYSHYAGGICYFINWDSLFFVFIGSLISACAFSLGHFMDFLTGLKEIFSFRLGRDKNRNVKKIFGGLTISTIVLGICSSIHGLITGVLVQQNVPLENILPVALFTTLYGLLIAVFVYFPVYMRHK